MRYFETKEKRPEKLISDKDYHSVRFFLMRACIVVFILGFTCMFFAWIYRNYWPNYRTIQAWSIFAGGVAWFSFMALAKSLGIQIKGITYSKLRAILRNEVEQPTDLDYMMRKQVYNSLYKMSDDWTLFPGIYEVNEAKKLAGVVTGPGGIFAMNFVVMSPKDRKFTDPALSLGPGSEALASKLSADVQTMLIFRKYKKDYQKKYGKLHEGLHMFTFQEMNAFISHRTEQLDAKELERVNKLIGKLSNADMSQDLNKL